MRVGVWETPNFSLACGVTLPTLRLVYATYGEYRGNNAILYPTSYGAQHSDIDWLIHPEGILDPQRWFVIIINMLGNGLSTSPSNDPCCGLRETGFWFSHWDNIRAQSQLLAAVFGIEELALIYGWSMGSQQAYYWGVHFGDRVRRLVALCGTARTTPHNQLFLESLRAAFTADPAWDGQRFQAIPERGYRAFSYIYASWAASQAFYRQGLYRDFGYTSLTDYIERGWEANYRRRDPHDLLAMIDTWLACDVGQLRPDGDYAAALGQITAETLVMAASTDLYFTREDCAAEAALIPKAQFQVIDSIWGHRAGNPRQSPADAQRIRTAVRMFLDSP